MTYIARYADRDAIARKLKGRLKVDIVDTEFFPVETVDEDLIDDILEEKENYVDLILGNIYTLPLTHPQPIIRTLVENLVMADLLQFNYVNTVSNSQDLSNLAGVLQQKAEEILDRLTIGTRINPLPNGEIDVSRSLKLGGETLVKELPPTSIVNNDIFVDKLDINDDFLYAEKGYDNLFSPEWRSHQR
jgi:hypothetical protein